MPAAIAEVTLAQMLNPVISLEHFLGTMLRRIRGLLGLPFCRSLLRRQSLGLAPSQTTPGSAAGRLGLRLRRGCRALLLFLVIFLVLVLQLRQLDLHFPALSLGADKNLQHRTMDLIKQLNWRLLRCDTHCLDIVVKGK